MPERVGFIGLGIMGKPMARNLIAAGFKLVVHSRTRAPVDELVAEGAESADSPEEVARRTNTVITMLPDSPDVRKVYAGEQGAFHGGRPGSLMIDMSTISPLVSQELAALASASGVGMLDAPVSGGEAGARAGTLSIMVGGTEPDFQRASTVFGALGSTVVHVGSHGSGQIVKACNQVVVALTIEAVSEALVLGSKAGVDPAVILKVLSSGLAGNRVMEVRGPNFLQHDFTPGFRVDLHSKDLKIALDTGHQEAVPLPTTALVLQMLETLRARGMGGADHSALLTIIEDLAQHTIGQTA